MTGTDVVLWDDILAVFKHASFVRHETKALPFLKDKELRILEPRRILAVPNSILEVVIEGQPGFPELDAFNPTPSPLRDLTHRRSGNSSTRGNLLALSRAPSSSSSDKCDSISISISSNSILKDSSHSSHNQTEDIADVFTRAASGDASAQISIAELYREGEEAPQDYERAMEWYMEAANQGDPIAQWNVGSLLYHGLGVKQDFLKAMTWYLKAARQGYSAAQYSIARLYECGQGVRKDEAKALEWYFRAAENGYVPAQQYLRFRREHTSDRTMPRPYSLLLKSID
ncbi:hypothetical protein FBU30_008656 [Linnemannia zychae]|nr:hypothetical protein FBU30_008656 [Linnemannia zychae]